MSQSIAEPKVHTSRFYEPILQIFKEATQPLKVGEVAEQIHKRFPEVQWAGYWGALYAVLNRLCEIPGSGFELVQKTPVRLYQYTETTATVASEPPKVSAEELFEDAEAQALKTLEEELTEQVQQMDDYAFEELVNRLIAAMGFGRHKTTKKSADGGIDGVVYGDALGLNVVYVQAKHYAPGNNVQSATVQQFIGAAKGRNGVFVTSSDFTKGARKEAENTGTSSHIALINGKEFVGYLIKYGIAIKTRRTYHLREVDKDYFAELNDCYAQG